MTVAGVDDCGIDLDASRSPRGGTRRERSQPPSASTRKKSSEEVIRRRQADGKIRATTAALYRKFIVVDHELLLITRANLSYFAENRNVEFGILVRDTALATSVEATMASKHGSLCELV